MIEIGNVKEKNGNLSITVNIDKTTLNNMMLAYGYGYTANIISQKIQELIDFEIGKRAISNCISKMEVG